MCNQAEQVFSVLSLPFLVATLPQLGLGKARFSPDSAISLLMDVAQFIAHSVPISPFVKWRSLTPTPWVKHPEIYW